MSDDSAPSASPTSANTAISVTIETAIGVAVLLVALVMMWGASQIPADAGYAGVGPNFLPWLVALALALCGVVLIWQARTGGFTHLPEPSGAPSGDWPALAWVVAGVVANASLIERLGFIISCGLCYMLAVRGLRWAEGKTAWGLKRAMTDLLIGLGISAPVFWLFTKVLAVNLPALTGTGWL
jgi:putative tricarboxylic transport membrane protein